MEVIENFLPQNIFNELRDIFFSDKFPWYYVDHIAHPNDNKNFYFIHELISDKYPCSQQFHLIHPILGALKYSAFIRMRANLYTKRPTQTRDAFHVDLPGDQHNMTGILYLNTNNGYTLFKNNEKVESVENRLVLFKGTEEHCSVAQTDTKVRVVININFYP
mgnify:FL=1|jgi:hypothetical protein|tara:strand:+ start:730 stop:1215 length:486 start_codon:yes stop_codon:yes gene_type:complete